MSQTNEQLFPNEGKVSTDDVFKEKSEKWRKKWNPPPSVIKKLNELNDTIVNPKGILKPVK